ncbi:hypothetical protein BVRB_1g010920 isoform B [Beta vulgaris subsp. vulgaris]|nr:hypothetical protein BVRB_1g010920 isoform B [Beta vulgaris subsp. vulgaris]
MVALGCVSVLTFLVQIHGSSQGRQQTEKASYKCPRQAQTQRIVDIMFVITCLKLSQVEGHLFLR